MALADKKKKKEKKRKSRFSVMGVKELKEDEDHLDQMAPKYYVTGEPRWLRGEYSRGETEAELRQRGLVDGRFIVRERNMAKGKVQFALSYTYLKKFYHHLLNKEGKDGDFTLNDTPLRVKTLNEAIQKFQQRQFPGVATKLESDPPPLPGHVPDLPVKGYKKKKKKKGRQSMKKGR